MNKEIEEALAKIEVNVGKLKDVLASRVKDLEAELERIWLGGRTVA